MTVNVEKQVSELVEQIMEHDNEIVRFEELARRSFSEHNKQSWLEDARAQRDAYNRKLELLKILRG